MKHLIESAQHAAFSFCVWTTWHKMCSPNWHKYVNKLSGVEETTNDVLIIAHTQLYRIAKKIDVVILNKKANII